MKQVGCPAEPLHLFRGIWVRLLNGWIVNGYIWWVSVASTGCGYNGCGIRIVRTHLQDWYNFHFHIFSHAPDNSGKDACSTPTPLSIPKEFKKGSEVNIKYTYSVVFIVSKLIDLTKVPYECKCMECYIQGVFW